MSLPPLNQISRLINKSVKQQSHVGIIYTNVCKQLNYPTVQSVPLMIVPFPLRSNSSSDLGEQSPKGSLSTSAA